jgi:hypothetical protein
MKQILVTVFIAAICLNPVFASAVKGEEPVVTGYIQFKKSIKKIIINVDADVLFTKNESSELLIEEKAGSFISFIVHKVNGFLEIKSREYYSGKKPLICIPAQYLETLEMHGNYSINSVAVFKAAELNMFINGDCKIHMRSLGKVNIEAAPDYTPSYAQNTVMKTDTSLY